MTCLHGYIRHKRCDCEAKELAALRAEVERLKAVAAIMDVEYKNLMASSMRADEENARLRAALEEIANRKLYPGVAEQMREAAREALSNLDPTPEESRVTLSTDVDTKSFCANVDTDCSERTPRDEQ